MVESGKEQPMPPARPSDEPTPKVINRLMKDFQGSDKKASKCAFEALVRLGSPIRELLASPQCDPWDGSYSYDDMAAVINEAGLSDANVLAGLAQAVVGPGGSIRLAAIQVCKRINPPHQAVLDALAQALGDRRDNIRAEAARALGELRVAAPSVLKGLAAALRDSDPHVVFEAVKALGDIGAPSPDVIAGLVNFLGNANSLFCGWAIFALQSIGSFDQSVHDAVRQVATSTFSFPGKPPSGYGDDYDYWWESYHNAERHHKENRQLAVDLLSRIPVEPMVQEAMASTTQQPILSTEDQRILTWFKDVDLTVYLTPLQLFWCIVQVDRDAIESEDRAIGYSKLQATLEQLRPTYAAIRLPTSNGYIREGCLEVVHVLLDKEPFFSNAWSDEEREQTFRATHMRGKRRESRWTRRARKAFHYVDRFLSIMKCLPKMTVTDG
jgi:hypothetical protein